MIVAGADGKALPVGLAGWRGLRPLSPIAVVGTVARTSDDGVLVIHARGIYVSTNPGESR